MAFSFTDYGNDESFILFSIDERGARSAFDFGCDCRGKDPECEDCDWEVRREPALDKYAPGPIAAQQWLDEGYSVECAGCSRTITYDSEEDAKRTVFDLNGDAYCGRLCLERKQRAEKHEQQLRERALRRWPGIRIARVTVDRNCLSNSVVEFHFSQGYVKVGESSLMRIPSVTWMPKTDELRMEEGAVIYFAKYLQSLQTSAVASN